MVPEKRFPNWQGGGWSQRGSDKWIKKKKNPKKTRKNKVVGVKKGRGLCDWRLIEWGGVVKRYQRPVGLLSKNNY